MLFFDHAFKCGASCHGIASFTTNEAMSLPLCNSS